MVVVIIYLFISRSPREAASCSQTDICWGHQADPPPGQARSRLPLRLPWGGGAGGGPQGAKGPLLPTALPWAEIQAQSLAPASPISRLLPAAGLSPSMALAWHRVPGVGSTDKGLMGKKEFEGKNRHAGYIGVLRVHPGPQTLQRQALFPCFL